MILTLLQRSHLRERVTTSYQSQKKQARSLGQFLGYSCEDLMSLAEKQFIMPNCLYCAGPLGIDSLAIGFKTPIDRGGRFTFRNLEICCADCRSAKEALDSQEFRELCLVMRTWPKPVRKLFVSRLLAGAKVVPAALPRPGSLEWFFERNEGA